MGKRKLASVHSWTFKAKQRNRDQIIKALIQILCAWTELRSNRYRKDKLHHCPIIPLMEHLFNTTDEKWTLTIVATNPWQITISSGDGEYFFIVPDKSHKPRLFATNSTYDDIFWNRIMNDDKRL